MKHVYKLTALAGAVMLLGGCSYIVGENGYFRNKGGDYVGETTHPGLVIPENLNPVPSEDFMVIPEITSDVVLTEGEVIPRADRRIIRDDGAAYKIVDGSNPRTLQAELPTDRVWSKALGFWKANDIPVVEQDQADGVIVTDWVQIGEQSRPGLMRRMFGRVIDLENSETSQEKFRLTIKPGTRSNTSEITLQHVRRPVEADLSQPVDWDDNALSSSSRLEYGLLDEMLVFLVEHREEQSVSLQDRNLNIADQASLVRDGNGNPVLRIEQGFARSWQGVEAALSGTGIKVLDRNRSAGLIFIDLPGGDVEAVEKEEKKGWFSGLFGRSKSKGEEAVTGQDEYRVRVQSLGDTTSVTLEKDLNTLPPINMSERFLELLRDNLS